MKLTFLGSGAAEGYPALWCRCDRCQLARQRGGRNLRFRSAALLNDDLLIDIGPDVLASAIRLGVDLAPVQAALYTHPHTDHLDPSALMWRRKGFCATPLPVLHLYAGSPSHDKLAAPDERAATYERLRLVEHPVAAFEHFQVRTGGSLPPDPRFISGDGDASAATVPTTAERAYEVQSFQANHAEPHQQAMFYAIRQTAGPEVQGRTGATLPSLLYATDTGSFPERTWAALNQLARAGWRFTGAVIDSTNGAGPAGEHHLNLDQMARHQVLLGERGLLADGAYRVAHHFSHNGTPPYEELASVLDPMGIIPSYDGLVLHL